MSDLSPHSTDSSDETRLHAEERILLIRAERWINYARAEVALTRLTELLEYPQRDRMPCLLLFVVWSNGNGQDENSTEIYSRAPGYIRQSSGRHKVTGCFHADAARPRRKIVL
jgi:hypothetical protein